MKMMKNIKIYTPRRVQTEKLSFRFNYNTRFIKLVSFLICNLSDKIYVALKLKYSKSVKKKNTFN